MKKNDAEMQPKGYGADVKMPKHVDSSDYTGTRNASMVNGIGMGKADLTGPDHQFDGGRHNGVCYTHERKSYQKK